MFKSAKYWNPLEAIFMFEQFIEFFMYRQKAREKSALLARAAKAAKQEDQENDRGVNEEVQGMQLEEIATDDNDNGSGGDYSKFALVTTSFYLKKTNTRLYQ